jgi:DNA-binding CsgD family transcriptional regulator
MSHHGGNGSIGLFISRLESDSVAALIVRRNIPIASILALGLLHAVAVTGVERPVHLAGRAMNQGTAHSSARVSRDVLVNGERPSILSHGFGGKHARAALDLAAHAADQEINLRAAGTQRRARNVEEPRRGMGEPNAAGVTAADGLTNRESEILALLSEGLSNKEIADRVDISYDTVRAHLRHIYEKIHVRGRTEAVKMYLKSSNPSLARIGGAT